MVHLPINRLTRATLGSLANLAPLGGGANFAPPAYLLNYRNFRPIRRGFFTRKQLVRLIHGMRLMYGQIRFLG